MTKRIYLALELIVRSFVRVVIKVFVKQPAKKDVDRRRGI